jgi:uncharacterized damage-inducible protein DinB
MTGACYDLRKRANFQLSEEIMAKAKQLDLGTKFLQEAQFRLKNHLLPQIVKSLESLSDQDIWWRPNPASNSVGNLVLHLSGNVRQWIISGLGGAADVRKRDEEFSEQGPLPRQGLVALLRSTVNEACRVLARTPVNSLGDSFSRQGYQTTRQSAITRVVEHFAYHTGQIVYATKQRTARDLHFTHLPKTKPTPRAKAAPRKPRR